MRMLFWWGGPVGYFDAGTQALANAGHEVSVVFERPSAELPFDEMMQRGFGHLTSVEFWTGRPPRALLRASFEALRPDVLVVASWGYPEMVWEALRAPAHVLRLVAADTPWGPSVKQFVGQFTHRKILPRAFDGAWVAGGPQRLMLSHLGFESWQIIDNLNCCDTELFMSDKAPAARLDGPFLYVGRRIPIKGIIELIDAFKLFRRQTGSERRLVVVGNGPVSVSGEGIDLLPFATPSEVREIMDEAFALVHPARREHWGVVVHEAACMGLPLVLSPFMFAGSRFLWPGVNGLCAGPDVVELAQAMEEIDKVDVATYERMSRASAQLGRLLDRKTWVSTLEEGIARIHRNTGRGVLPRGGRDRIADSLVT